MINWQELTIDMFVEQLRTVYQRTYGDVNNDLRKNYASFYWNSVHPYIHDALQYLRLTEDGKQWVAKHVHINERTKKRTQRSRRVLFDSRKNPTL